MRLVVPTLFQKYAAKSRNRKVAAFAVFLICFGFLFWYGAVTRGLFLKPEPVVVSPVLTESGAALSLPKATPMKIRIKKANIEANFEAPLGLKESGEIETPESYETVAYYKYGPTPGEIGPAVVLGHVDSFEGPAVFFSLGQLTEGDQIDIERVDGTIATFAVTSMERRPQRDFPTASVYGDIPYAGLRLITCTGIYDHGELRYSHNLIVYAALVATSTKAIE